MNLKYLSYSENKAISDASDSVSTLISIIEELNELLEEKDNLLIEKDSVIERLEVELAEQAYGENI